MYNTNGVRDWGELLEISQQRYRFPKLKGFALQIKMHSLYGNT